MVWNRRFLRVAALGAVFALGLAGTALAATRTWTGGGTDNKWDTANNWTDNTKPTTGDTAVIDSADVLVDGAAAAKDVKLGEGAKLTLGAILTLDNDGMLEATGSATVTSKVAGGLTFTAINKVKVAEGKTLTLAADGGTIVGAAAALELSGKGALSLKTPVTMVTDLKITERSWLIVEADTSDSKGVLPALAGTGNTVTIEDGIITVGAEHFGVGTGVVTKFVMQKGALELQKPLGANITTVDIQNGDLFVNGTGSIGTEAIPDGVLKLGVAGTSSGHLHLDRDMTLKTLTTAHESTIRTNGKTLTVAELDSNELNAEVKGGGTLYLKKAAGANTATLKKAVEGTVKIETAGNAALTLTAEKDVSAVEFAGAPATTATLELNPNANVGTLSFADVATSLALKLGGNKIGRLNLNSTKTLTVTSDTSENTINFLAPVAGADLKMAGAGTAPLRILNGTKANWNVALEGNTNLAVMGKDLLGGEVTATLGISSKLTLPGGEFPKLTLNATEDSTISVDVAAQDPVLKVETINVTAGKTLTVNRPDTWHFEPSGDVTLLAAKDDSSVNLNTTGDIKGAPESDDVALIKLNTTKTALILTPRAGLKFPVLEGTAAASGNQCNVAVKVVDGKVDAASWTPELNVVPLGSATHSILAAGTTESVLYGVQLADNFKSGFLRVKAKKEGVTANLWGVVDVPLKRGAGDSGDSGDKVGGNLNKPESWSRTAISGDTVVLTSKLKLDGTPKSLKVKASGMKNEPKAELLDATGKVVAKSSVPSVSAAKDYTLRLTCKTTQAEIDKGAKIEQVTVTMSDGTRHDIPVNVKLSDMKIGTPDGKKPGGDNGGGKNPGGDNGGGKNPGGDNGGGKNPGGEDDGKKGSSGGGCDAGFGGLALALGAAFLLKRKA